MKVLFVFVTFLFGMISCTRSNDSEKSSLLWKITGNKLKKPSYLFGTYHTIPHQFLESVPGFYEAFYSTKVFVGEIDNTSTQRTSILNRIRMPSDTTYKDLLSDSDVCFLDSVLHEYLNVSFHQMNNLRPAYIGFILAEAVLQKFEEEMNDKDLLSKPQSDGIDAHLFATAKKNSVPIMPLETHSDREKIGLYDLLWPKGKLENQVDNLIRLAKEPESDSLRMVLQLGINIKKAYLEQSLIKLEEAQLKLNDYVVENDWTKKLSDVLIKQRHELWMEKIPLWLKEYNTIFIAVGASHLTGEYSLINLLRKEGYIVEPVLD